MKFILFILFSLCALTGVFFIGYFMGMSSLQPIDSSYSVPKRTGQKGLINPLIDYEISQNLFTGELKNFKNKIQNIIDKDSKNNLVTEESVYFRAMQDGPWFGINLNREFSPASLLKVPIMVTYYRMAHDNPKILEQKIKYDEKGPDENDSSYFKPEKYITPGNEYTVDELINYMISYSDNNALDLLVTQDFPNEYFKTFKDLGINYNEKDTPSKNITTTQTYATFFRTLYNASYLDTQYSEKALELLTKTQFQLGIRSGIPKNIKYAGKFGERTIDNKKQLHDCGIIYHPKNPYLLCVMTSGDNFVDLESAINHVSKATWEEVQNQVNSYKNSYN